MPNENCLAGMKCPNCGSEGPYHILGTACFEVSDDGASEFENLQWEADSSICCGKCGRHSTVEGLRNAHNRFTQQLVDEIADLLYMEGGKLTVNKEWGSNVLMELGIIMAPYRPSDKELAKISHDSEDAPQSAAPQ